MPLTDVRVESQRTAEPAIPVNKRPLDPSHHRTHSRIRPRHNWQLVPGVPDYRRAKIRKRVHQKTPQLPRRICAWIGRDELLPVYPQ